MVSVEDTAQSMFAHKKRSLQSMIMTFREIKGIVDKVKNTATNDVESKYNFTGQHTDIVFVDTEGSMNINAINQIKDENLRNNVMRNFSDAINDGYIKLNDGCFTLTDKGKEHINSDSFKEQFQKDQLRSMSENKAQINLTGKSSDLNVFRYVDNINLNHLAYKDPAAFKRVVSYFEQCEKYDFVKIGGDGTVTPTDKCKHYLNQNQNFHFDINKITPDNIEDITKKISQSSKGTVNATSKSVQETTKKVAQEATKKATQEAAKTATKEGAKVATKTAVTAGTGAATAGVGIAVTAVVELSKKGAKAMSESTNLSQTTPSIQKR